MHGPFLLSWHLTFDLDLDLQNIRQIAQEPFRNLLVKIIILIYNRPWFTIKASLKFMSYYLNKSEMKTVHL